jgi:hypothetical protein
VGAPAFRHVLNFYRDAGLDALMKRRLSGVSGRTAIPINRVGIAHGRLCGKPRTNWGGSFYDCHQIARNVAGLNGQFETIDRPARPATQRLRRKDCSTPSNGRCRGG